MQSRRCFFFIYLTGVSPRTPEYIKYTMAGIAITGTGRIHRQSNDHPKVDAKPSNESAEMEPTRAGLELTSNACFTLVRGLAHYRCQTSSKRAQHCTLISDRRDKLLYEIHVYESMTTEQIKNIIVENFETNY